ncbi:MAG: RNA methyltransferase, partial [Bacteroidota bacterium]|nr:RNA methyltransferase [Bacteroidota bacterium]
MKIHKILVQTISQCLQQIFEEGNYADKVVESALKQDKRWGSRDRRFLAENIYEMVRWWRLINEIEGSGNCRNYFRLFAIWCIVRNIEIPDWEEFGNPDPELILKKYQELQSVRKIRESVPDWLDSAG